MSVSDHVIGGMSTSTESFIKTPGCDVLTSPDDPRVLLMGNPIPLWVRLPPELSGERRMVLGSFHAPCPGPACADSKGSVRHLELEGKEQYHVSDCSRCGFLWYKPRAKGAVDP